MESDHVFPHNFVTHVSFHLAFAAFLGAVVLILDTFSPISEIWDFFYSSRPDELGHSPPRPYEFLSNLHPKLTLGKDRATRRRIILQ